MKKLVYIGRITPKAPEKEEKDIFIRINLVDEEKDVPEPFQNKKNLSLTGTITLAKTCKKINYGQVREYIEEMIEEIKFGKGMSKTKLTKLLKIWEKWHLNNLRDSCEHQRRYRWDQDMIQQHGLPPFTRFEKGTECVPAMWVYPSEHPFGRLGLACNVCGFRFKTQYEREELPEEVIKFLTDLKEHKLY